MKEKNCLICCIIGFILLMIGGALFNIYFKTPVVGFGAFLGSVGCLLIGIGYGNIIGREEHE